MPTFDFYTRRGCHLCEVMLEALLPILRDRAELAVHDIDSNPDWLQQYDVRVPVLEYAGELVCQFELDTEAVSAVLDRIAEKPV